ncbi:MAG: type II toxin-antitoxin system HicA family toxin [Alistipes indistinctus]|nr:type II toxin-antitoxin system HicA family toxin [Alistipes indistinctus]
MVRLHNVSLKIFRGFLEEKGLKCIRNKGGHEVWSRSDLRRPVVLQSHIDPIPEFIVKNNLKTIGATISDLLRYMGS